MRALRPGTRHERAGQRGQSQEAGVEHPEADGGEPEAGGGAEGNIRQTGGGRAAASGTGAAGAEGDGGPGAVNVTCHS